MLRAFLSRDPRRVSKPLIRFGGARTTTRDLRCSLDRRRQYPYASQPPLPSVVRNCSVDSSIHTNKLADSHTSIFHSKSAALHDSSSGKDTPPITPTTNAAKVESLFKNHQIPPNQLLNNYYQVEMACPKSIASVMRTSSTFLNGRLWWTASFECPVTQVKHESGRLRDTEWIEVKDKIYYTRKRSATSAAAALAVDRIEYTNTQILEPRFCENDPSTYEDNVIIVDPVSSTADEEVVEESPPPFYEQTVIETEDGEEEFVITDIPKSGGVLPHLAKFSSLGFVTDARQDLIAAVRATKNWLAVHQRREVSKEKKDLHRVYLPSQDLPYLLQSANITLASLARANQAVPPSLSNFGIERLAGRVIDVLQKSDDSKPDADIYNSYLRCLEGPTPLLVAKKAEKIVNLMKGENMWRGGQLPRPNSSTTNVLIQLWAQVGGESGRYERMESSFEPTRESFLAILSSAAYAPTLKGDEDVFDTDFARQCIDRMHELYHGSNNGGLLRPDTEVWNAPLRWNGGSQWSQSRPYARAIEWDDHASMFKHGLVTKAHRRDKFSEAEKIEGWLNEMEESEYASPDIESYEALIQAWVRTCTKEGLEKADKIGATLLEDNGCELIPRLHTFHPILASWLYSKDPNGLDRVGWWLERLFKRGHSLPAVRPDSRVVNAYITGQTLYQEARISSYDKGEFDSKLKDELVDIAISCSAKLSLLINNPSRKSIFPKTVFTQTVKAWHNAATVCAMLRDEKNLSICVQHMRNTVNCFDDIVVRTMRKEYPSGAGLSTKKDASEDFLSLASNAHYVYFAFSFGIRELYSKNKGVASVGNALAGTLGDAEKMLRKSVEFAEIEAYTYDGVLPLTRREDRKSRQCAGREDDEMFLYNDMYSFSELGKGLTKSSPSREAYLWQLVQLVGNVSTTEVTEVELVRLCHLLQQVARVMYLSPKLQDAIGQHCRASRMVDAEARQSINYNMTLSRKIEEVSPRNSGKLLQKMRQLIPATTKGQRKLRKSSG